MRRRLGFPLLASLLCALPCAGVCQTLAEIAQSGISNTATVDQLGGGDVQVSIEQVGDDTRVGIVQSGSFKQFTATLSGNDLSAIATQHGEGTADLSLSMAGLGGIVEASQFTEIGGSALGTIWQAGTGNSALFYQSATSGAVNVLALVQDGNDNFAGLTQSGSGNQLVLTQTGDLNFALIDQAGAKLELQVNQFGGASVAISQTRSP